MLHTNIAVWKHYIMLNFKIIDKNVIWWSLYAVIVSNDPKNDLKIIYSFIAFVNDVAPNFQILLLIKTLHFHSFFFLISVRKAFHLVQKMKDIHCVKSVQIQSYLRSAFSRIRTEYGEILRISPYSVRMRGNTDQK